MPADALAAPFTIGRRSPPNTIRDRAGETAERGTPERGAKWLDKV